MPPARIRAAPHRAGIDSHAPKFSNRGVAEPIPLRYDMILPNGEPLRWDMGPEYTWDGFVPASAFPNPHPHPMQQNRISIVIPPAVETAFNTKIDEARALLAPFLVSLTDDERAALFKLGDARLAFDTKCDNYMHAQPALVPDDITIAEYDKDGAAWGAIGRMQAKVGTMNGELSDTAMVVGSDRMDADLVFYNYLAFKARTGAPGADTIHDDLKSSYPGRRTPRTPPTPPTPPTP